MPRVGAANVHDDGAQEVGAPLPRRRVRVVREVRRHVQALRVRHLVVHLSQRAAVPVVREALEVQLQHLRQAADARAAARALLAVVAGAAHVVAVEHLLRHVALQALLLAVAPRNVEREVEELGRPPILEVHALDQVHLLALEQPAEVLRVAAADGVHQEPQELLRVLLQGRVDAEALHDAGGVAARAAPPSRPRRGPRRRAAPAALLPSAPSIASRSPGTA